MDLSTPKILGILGGGQLGRMSAMAAAQLGIATHIYCPDRDSPAFQVTNLKTVAAYEDFDALKKFASSVDVIGYEFENIPIETIEFLSKHKPVRPGRKILEVSQNRLAEKKFLNDIGVPTAPWAAAHAAEDIDAVLDLWKSPACIVKTARFGYDGKGQNLHRLNDDSSQTWKNLSTDEAVIEGIVDFAHEASIIIARDESGNCQTFPVTLNTHRNHILAGSLCPSGLDSKIEHRADEIVRIVAQKADLVGLLALELFITQDGKVIANEIAPRPHNSGHWTMDGCNVSQFEQHVRAVCGLPLIAPYATAKIRMENLIGDDILKVADYLSDPDAHIHLYGKKETRPGRKMGHVNFVER